MKLCLCGYVNKRSTAEFAGQRPGKMNLPRDNPRESHFPTGLKNWLCSDQILKKAQNPKRDHHSNTAKNHLKAIHGFLLGLPLLQAFDFCRIIVPDRVATLWRLGPRGASIKVSRTQGNPLLPNRFYAMEGGKSKRQKETVKLKDDKRLCLFWFQFVFCIKFCPILSTLLSVSTTAAKSLFTLIRLNAISETRNRLKSLCATTKWMSVTVNSQAAEQKSWHKKGVITQ